MTHRNINNKIYRVYGGKNKDEYKLYKQMKEDEDKNVVVK